jgi:hypothetical protein
MSYESHLEAPKAKVKRDRSQTEDLPQDTGIEPLDLDSSLQKYRTPKKIETSPKPDTSKNPDSQTRSHNLTNSDQPMIQKDEKNISSRRSSKSSSKSSSSSSSSSSETSVSKSVEMQNTPS